MLIPLYYRVECGSDLIFFGSIHDYDFISFFIEVDPYPFIMWTCENLLFNLLSSSLAVVPFVKMKLFMHFLLFYSTNQNIAMSLEKTHCLKVCHGVNLVFCPFSGCTFVSIVILFVYFAFGYILSYNLEVVNKLWLLYIFLIHPPSFWFRVHEGRKSYELQEGPQHTNERILCLGLSRKRPVLKWENNMAWPGKLTLTDNALYFEVLIISIWLNEIESNKRRKRYWRMYCFPIWQAINRMWHFLGFFFFFFGVNSWVCFWFVHQ